ncbi:MAG: Modulator of FtsH protease HflK [Alphaproteobacteria bacterium MarineAlpha6_Bin6]|nr:MAG: Modulator of FtsH protease HflK [Alphaproteobacteria bacterium MarineAlpha6_Bin6]PPR33456.1 MAG: Modulator of FtsH protease HflK [Alphaproteobacteria bacterium MarineAlpha6_Bin5]|tara:strand:- start:2861 stop:3997 length:1137 start_codon:yes stop_codon:yes gene_type:complete
MPWKENNNGDGPWGEPGENPSNDSKKKNQNSNIDNLMNNLLNKLKKTFFNKDSGNKKNFLSGFLIILAIWLFSGFYKVNANEQGVVLRFGKWVRTTQPGLHYHLPYPIEIAKTPKVTKVNKTEIGFRTFRESKRLLSEESLMLTGDENIVDINFSVFWVIKDAGKYLFNLRSPENSIKAVSESVMREVIGNSRIASVLAEGRKEIELKSIEAIQSVLDIYGSGVQITQLQLQKVDPPDQVIDSFRDVQRARADKEKAINEAIAYRNDIIPKARGEAAQIVQQAEAYKKEIVARSEGDANRFNSILSSYKNNEDVTKNRIYLETLEEILQNANKVIIDTKQGSGVLPYLPLPEIKKKEKSKNSNEVNNNLNEEINNNVQ